MPMDCNLKLGMHHHTHKSSWNLPMTIAEHQTVQPPRYFWRRVAAFLIDRFIIALGFMFLMIIIAEIWPASVPYMPQSFFRTTACEGGTDNPNSADMLARLAPQPDETTFVRLCKTNAFMMPTRKWGFVMAEKTETEGAFKKTTRRTINFSVDKAGNFYMPDSVTISIFDSLQKLFSIAGFAFLLAEWASPGKLAVHLRVVPAEGYDEKNYSPPDFKRSLKRETLKQLPIVTIILVSGLTDIVSKAEGWQTDNVVEQMRFLTTHTIVLIGVALLFLAFIFYWLIQPMIWWNGTMRYDRMLGLRVVKAPMEAPPPATAQPT